MAAKRVVEAVALRPEVAWFAQQIELVLRANDHKGGWDGCTESWLCKRIADERGELKRAIARFERAVTSGEPNSTLRELVIKESADVAAFALMIADNVSWDVDKVSVVDKKRPGKRKGGKRAHRNP